MREAQSVALFARPATATPRPRPTTMDMILKQRFRQRSWLHLTQWEVSRAGITHIRRSLGLSARSGWVEPGSHLLRRSNHHHISGGVLLVPTPAERSRCGPVQFASGAPNDCASRGELLR